MFTGAWQSYSRRILFVIMATIAIVGLCVAFVSMQSYKLYTQAEHNAFLSTSAFSQLVANWLVSERDRQQERVLSAAEAMLLGEHVYINVAYHGDTIVDIRAQNWDEAFFPSSAVTNSMIQRTDISFASVRGMLMIDAIVPLPGVEGAGNNVRVRIHAANLEQQIRSSKLVAALTGFLSWLAVLAVGAFARKAPTENAHLSAAVPPQEVADCIICGPLQIHTKRKTLSFEGHHVAYPPRLFHLLELLAFEQDKAFSADEIVQHVWSDTQYADANDVRQCVYRLRRRLNELQEGLGDCITNIKGFGYRFDADAVAASKHCPAKTEAEPQSSTVL